MGVYNYPPKELVKVLPGNYVGKLSDQLLINDIQIDSRRVSPGALFIALKGSIDNGQQYISGAVENGAVAVLVESDFIPSVANIEIPVIGVDNLKACLGEIAQKFFGSSSESLFVCGITGTNGKSSIVSFVAQLDALLGGKAATIGTLGYGIINSTFIETGMTTPDVVSCHRILFELANDDIQSVAMEVSSHGIDQKRINNIYFDVGVISNITRDHLDYHGSFKEYARIKKSFLLSSQCKTAIINLDDKECAVLAEEMAEQNKHFIGYGIESPHADVQGNIKSYTDTGVVAHIESPWGEADVLVPLIGAFNFSNLLAAICVNCQSGKNFDALIEVIPDIHAVEGRTQEVSVEGGLELPRVYIDFAHTPDALEKVLKALKLHANKNLWVVFGCGGDRDRGKRSQMGKIAAAYADRIILTSDNPRTEDPELILADILSGVPENSPVEKIVERKLAISMAVGSSDKNDVVLIAGKGHESYQIVDREKLPFSDCVVAKKALEQRRDAFGAMK